MDKEGISAGPRIFSKSMAETIFLAACPDCLTFAPFVAVVGRMSYSYFFLQRLCGTYGMFHPTRIFFGYPFVKKTSSLYTPSHSDSGPRGLGIPAAG